jgi:hypothetical protein
MASSGMLRRVALVAVKTSNLTEISGLYVEGLADKCDGF